MFFCVSSVETEQEAADGAWYNGKRNCETESGMTWQSWKNRGVWLTGILNSGSVGTGLEK